MPEPFGILTFVGSVFCHMRNAVVLTLQATILTFFVGLWLWSADKLHIHP
jgi:hypothetical protein